MRESGNTPSRSDSTIPFFKNREDCETLRSVLDKAGYTEQAVADILEANYLFLRSKDVPVLLSNTRGETPRDFLVRLFLMQLPVKIEQLRAVIDPVSPEHWIEAGLIRQDGPWALAAVRLYPFQGKLFASDVEAHIYTPDRSDFVMGIAASSLDLLNLTVRRHSRLTLDLGTGCGVQALFAAAHSDRVLAVDSNPRAAKMTELNLMLNDISNVECRVGHLFEPVEGMKFDLIVTNPPFVISPEVRFLYRDGGGEENICQRIVRQAPVFLEEGGFCQMMCNWPERTGEDWPESMAGWFEGLGCDVWVKRIDTFSPGAYASLWLRSSEQLTNDEYAQRFDQWITYFERHKIDSIGSGFIVLQRTGGEKTWFEADADPWQITGPSGDSVQNRFRMRRFLEDIETEEQFLDLPVKPSPDLVLDQRWMPSAEGWAPTGAKLGLSKGLQYEGEIDGSVARFVTTCDGRKTLKDLLSSMAASGNADPDAIKPAFVALARRFIENGFIVPVGEEVNEA